MSKPACVYIKGKPMASMAAPDALNPIAGREREREQLLQLFDLTISGSGSLVLVSGQAGIGKTTLIENVAHVAAEQGMLVINGAKGTSTGNEFLNILHQINRASQRNKLSQMME
jgi:predicted ATPase